MPRSSVAAPCQTAVDGRLAARDEDNPSSDATLWEGYASEFDGIITPPLASTSAVQIQDTSARRQGRKFPEPSPANHVTPAPCSSPKQAAARRGQPSARPEPTTPRQDPDKHRQLLHELGWDSPSQPREPPSQAVQPNTSVQTDPNAPRSSISLDPVDVGAPWSQTYGTQFIRDQWLIGVGLKAAPRSSGSTARHAPLATGSTPPDQQLEEVEPPTPGRLGLGQMRARRHSPATFAAARPSGSLTGVAVREMSAGGIAPTLSPPLAARASHPRKPNLLDQIDAQISGFDQNPTSTKPLDHQQPRSRYPPSVSNRDGGSARGLSLETPGNERSRIQSLTAFESFADEHSPRKGTNKENVQARGMETVANGGSSKDVPVLCIDSDDEVVPRRRPVAEQRKKPNAFDVLLRSPERAPGMGKRASSPAKGRASPTKVLFSSTNLASPSTTRSPRAKAVTAQPQPQPKPKVFRASKEVIELGPTQDRSPPVQERTLAAVPTTNQKSSTARANAASPRMDTTRGGPSGSEDSIGLGAMEEQDWALDVDGEDELQRIERAIAAEPGPESDPIFVHDIEPPPMEPPQERPGEPSRPTAARSRLTLPLRAAEARPATASTSRQAIAERRDPDDDFSDDDDPLRLPFLSAVERSPLSIKLICDLSPERQQIFYRQLSGKRKAGDSGDQGSDGGESGARKSKGKGKTWGNTWVDPAADHDNDDDDDDDDEEDSSEEASGFRRAGRAAGASTSGRSGRAGSSQGRARKASSSSRSNSKATAGAKKSAYFKKRNWQAKHGRGGGRRR